MNIPTAKEFLSENFEGSAINPQILIEFAKLHVQAALEAAYYNSDVKVIDADMTGVIYGVDSETILNAYPLENIK